MLTRDSRIGEIYATPIGHDIIHTLLLQTGLPEKAVAPRSDNGHSETGSTD